MPPNNSQLEYLNYRKTVRNNESSQNLQQRPEQGMRNPLNHVPQNHDNFIPQSSVAHDLIYDKTHDHRGPLTLNSRFRMIDTYDFAQKDNKAVRTRNRPICKWWLKNQCNSDVCIYRHSEHEILNRSSQRSHANYVKSNRPECRYHLQGRCWFGENYCRNLHPKEY